MKDNLYIAQYHKNILFYLAAFLLPNIFLFFLFNSNKILNHLVFGHFVVLGLILSILSICILIFYRKITNTIEGALVILLASWVFFWLFEPIRSIFITYSAPLRSMAVLASLAGVIVAQLWLFRKYNLVLRKFRRAFLSLAIIINALFVYNFAPALYTEVLVLLANPPPAEQPWRIKRDFVVDDSLPNPDIYWFHMDAMMGFSAMEKYFGDSLDELRAELIKRGFVINYDAKLRAGATLLAVPALLSPEFFDSYLSYRLAEVVDMLRIPRLEELMRRFQLDRLNLYEDVEPYHEFFHAFMAAGYTTVIISPFYSLGLRPIDRFYARCDRYPLIIKSENKRRINVLGIKNLTQLIISTTPFFHFGDFITEWINEQTFNRSKSFVGIYSFDFRKPIPMHYDVVNRIAKNSSLGETGIWLERWIYRRLYDSFFIPSPKVVYVVNAIAHCPYDLIYETGKLENPSPDNPYAVDLLYLPQYKYAAEVMLRMIDMVLEHNPNAIIVLQGDHGIHGPGQEYLIEQGKWTNCQILEMNFSVISAIRIPPQYGGLDEPVDPLNITRLLVNRFVGENYNLLTFYK